MNYKENNAFQLASVTIYPTWLGETLTRFDVRANVDKWLPTSQLLWGFFLVGGLVLHMFTHMIYHCLCLSFSF